MSMFRNRCNLGCKSLHSALGVAFVLLAALPALAQKKHPAEEKGIASQKNEIETSIAFSNRSQQTIKVYWLNLEGKRELKQELKAGEQTTQKTFLTHPWLLTDERDNALGLYFPDAELRFVTYRGERERDRSSTAPSDNSKPATVPASPEQAAVLEASRRLTFGAYTASEFSQLATNKSIQEELKMTAEQVQQAVATREELLAKFPTLARFGSGGPASIDVKVYAERSQAIEAALGKLLNADQAPRFRQIMLQSKARGPVPPSGRGTNVVVSAVVYPGVAEAVKLTDEQKKKLIAGTTPAEVLTAEQNSLIAKMLGEPFKGDFNAGVNSQFMETARAATFGNYSSEFNYLAENKSIQEELKMTADQVKQAVETRDNLPRFFMGDAKTSAERSQAVETALGKLLTAGQAPRFRQLMLQRREQAPNSPSFSSAATIVSAVVYPGVAAAVKLSDEQKKKLIAGTAPAEVLTADQKALIATLLGEPFQGNFDLAPSSRPPANPRSAPNRVRTEVTDASIKEIAGLKQLQTLDLSNSVVTDAGLKELAGLDQLQTLHLWHTKITDTGLKELAGLQQLQTLNLVGTQVTDAGMKELARLEHLQTLYLGSTKVTDVGLKELAQLKKLQTLGLNHTQVTDAGLKELAGLKQLQMLNLWKTQVTDAGLKELAGLTQLQTLYLFETKVTDAGLKELVGLKLLQTLDIRSTQVTGAGVSELQKALPALKMKISRSR